MGYVTSDFQTPTPYESEGARTLTGEPFAVEAAIYLSWHHSSSPITFRQMRFLIISNSEFEMIIGSDTISKHSLLVPPVFATGSRSVYEPSEDPTVREMRLDHAEAESEIENLERDLQKDFHPCSFDFGVIQEGLRREKLLYTRWSVFNFGLSY
ncbi:uncharacterized protein M421DRAFT_272224 [Didymella exigua CBS 183.55]|uniref:Uncharacterized protein n=1 Tax=Didymella exigua CBS 183.55 TaxID=1150837 RepID=A0A6A5RBW8_9PLEO|nr:uncharacterized protein M421DRAFT_272224 [Didymella exigua CBS 183.55]KAF1924859.1 hypothetical protein M421DRAFT_272224 [Didymella exigua CBS 183.55]